MRLSTTLLVCGLALCAAPLRGVAQAPGMDATAAPTDAPPLRPGDVLRLRIWREPDLSGDFAVDERGEATLPRLGVVRVAEVPPDTLRAHLVERYRRYLNNPSVEIIPLRRVSVLGAVRAPGLFPVDATMRVADVVALAGGATPDGRADRVELRRDGRRVLASLDAQASVAASPIRSGDQIYVPQRSWLSRNTWLLSTLLGATATVTTILLSR